MTEWPALCIFTPYPLFSSTIRSRGPPSAVRWFTLPQLLEFSMTFTVTIAFLAVKRSDRVLKAMSMLIEVSMSDLYAPSSTIQLPRTGFQPTSSPSLKSSTNKSSGWTVVVDTVASFARKA